MSQYSDQSNEKVLIEVGFIVIKNGKKSFPFL